jgi:pimeloyl-ACP methyl ester carboxylesterase
VSVPPDLRLESEVRRERVPAASGDLAALVGEPPEGTARREPVLLVPGYTGSKEDFLPVLAPLARAGHPAVAIDLRGQFESTGPDDPAAYTLDALAKDITSLLATLGGEVHLVGHSFGGLVVRRAILSGARPRSLTLVGSGPAALGGRRAEIVGLMAVLLEEGGGGVEAIADASAALDREDPRMAGVPAEVVDFLRDRWLGNAPTGLRVMGQELTTAVDEVDELAAVGLPTFVVHGEADDAWLPDEQRRMAERLDARYAVVAGALHSPACEAPATFVDVLLDFLGSVRA